MVRWSDILYNIQPALPSNGINVYFTERSEIAEKRVNYWTLFWECNYLRAEKGYKSMLGENKHITLNKNLRERLSKVRRASGKENESTPR